MLWSKSNTFHKNKLYIDTAKNSYPEAFPVHSYIHIGQIVNELDKTRNNSVQMISWERRSTHLNYWLGLVIKWLTNEEGKNSDWLTTLQELLSNMKGKRPAHDTGERSVTAERRHLASLCYKVFLRHQTCFTSTAVAHNSHALTGHFFMNKQHQTLSEGENPAIKCVL